jgi:RNA polymerase sigma-70 factor (ECF subfamily)
MDDVQAIKRLKNGDLAGLESLFSRYQLKALRTAYLITQDEAQAEDIVQETFLYFHRAIRHFDESRAFEPYLLRAVVNRTLTILERDARNRSFSGDAQQIENLVERAASVEDQIIHQELKHQLLQALENLPPRQRAALVLRYYLGMKETEIVESLAAPPGTVKWLLARGRKHLRGLLTNERISHE